MAMLSILLISVMGFGGCFLVVDDVFHTDVTYEASYTGIGGMDITYVDEDGEVRTDYDVFLPWSRTYSVENGDNRVMFVQVESNLLTDSVSAKVRADGALVDSDSDLFEARASYLVD
jgi:hypothetical protein